MVIGEFSTPSATPTSSDPQVLISNFRNFLSFVGILKDDLKESKANITDGKIMLWPKDIDQKPIITKDFKTSLVWSEASKSASNIEDYSIINFFFWPVDQTTFSTYPIKKTDAALADLKNGKGVIVKQPKENNISITSVYLGYFESENYTPYLQPIYVFEGPNFVAYDSAITSDYLSPAK